MTDYLNQDALFEKVYKTYSQKVHRLCLGYTGNTMEADDLLQEVFIKVWQNLNKFKGDSQISTWIYRIAVNTCLYHLRSHKTKKTDPIDDSNSNQIVENDDKEQQIQLLYKSISELSEADRLIITLLLEEVSYKEIASIVETSEGNLRVKIHRIKQQLSAIYQKNEKL